jgi:hypothetical protein
MADVEKFTYYDNGRTKVLKPTDRIVIGTGGLAFEGSTSDDFEVLLAVEDPTADRTITFPDEDGDIALLQGDSLPKSLSFPVKNPSSTTALTKGQIVYISGHSGNKPEVSLARSDSASTMPAFGFIQSDIAAEAEGFVVYSGLFKGIDTNTNYSLGDTLYVSSTSAGDFQNSAPSGANLIQNVGKIVKSHATNGELLVGGAGRTAATPNLDEGHFFVGDANNQSIESAYQLPLSVGTSGQVLTSNGTNITFQDASGASEPTSLTASVAVGDFTPTHWITDPSNTTIFTINLPTTRYEMSQAFSNDGETFIIENPSKAVVTLRISDGWHFTNSKYYQSYIRHEGDYDDQGVGNGEPLTYNIQPLTNVKVHIKKEYEVNGTPYSFNINRVVYHVVVGGL